jgi:alkyl hydroperoxide reductase subunit F
LVNFESDIVAKGKTMKTIEVYSKQWCPYCLKAKALLKTKGLDYAEIDVTEDTAQEQEMIARSGRRTVPQIFIDGESFGGYDDISQLNATGELDKILGFDTVGQYAKVYDVIIIGAGPAGLSAAIYASRKNLATLLIALDIGGQMGTTYEIANYPGIQNISGPDLVAQFMAHVDQYKVEKLIGERVNSISIKDRRRVVITDSGKEILAKAVIITTGAFKRKLEIPGEKELSGKGVVYCSTCDGPLFKDLPIAIVGGGNSGLEAALEMDGIASKVYLISGSEWKGDQILQDKVAANKGIEALKFHKPVEIHGNQQVE